MNKKPIVGISTCLLGENVRYDGGNKLNLYLRDTLGKYVDYVPVCPEVECGMTVPREAVHLVEINGNIRLMTVKTNIDMTGKMNSWIKKRLKDLSKKQLCGFIFKSKSPSCGLSHVEVYRKSGVAKNSVGLFAKCFIERFPLLPVEKAESLNNDKRRENFIERIFLTQRWYALNEKRIHFDKFESIPNVGMAIASKLRRLGFKSPADLAGQDPFIMYRNLCKLTNKRHDPCLLDVFISAVSFCNGNPPKPWWKYTAERKAKLGK